MRRRQANVTNHMQFVADVLLRTGALLLPTHTSRRPLRLLRAPCVLRHQRCLAPGPALCAHNVVPLGGLVRRDRSTLPGKRQQRRRRGDFKEQARSGAEERRENAIRDGVIPFEWLLVLDVEATCDIRGRDWKHEIIMFSVVALNLRTLQVCGCATASRGQTRGRPRPAGGGRVCPFFCVLFL